MLLPTVKTSFGEDVTIYLLQDNSSVHNSHLVQTWIDDQENLELIRLSPKSPDLNVIENMWAIMVQNWDASQIRNIHNLKQHVHELWDHYRGLDYCQKLVQSMGRRLQDVIDAEGGYTKY